MTGASAQGVRLTNTGPTTFTNLRVATQGASAIPFESTATTSLITVDGTSSLTSLSTTEPALKVAATNVTMAFDSIFSDVPVGLTVNETGDVPAAAAAPPLNSEITNLTDTASLTVGMTVTGNDIPAGATIATIDSATQITLSTPVTAGAGATGEPLVFAISPGIAIDFTGTPTGTLNVVTEFEVDGTDGTAANTTPDGVTITLP